MAETEARIILINENNQAVVVKPTNEPGVNLLSSLRNALVAGIDGGLLVTNPFVATQPETARPEAKSAKSSETTLLTNRQHTLELATAAYTDRPQDPQGLFDFYQAHWDYHGIELMSLSQRDTRVPAVPYSEEEIRQFMKLEDPKYGNPDADLGYFHLPILASADERIRILIGKGFPYMGSWVFEPGYNITNGHTISGWMRVDASLDAPFRKNKNGELTGLDEDELKNAIKDAGRIAQTINIYGPSGDVIKKVFKYFPDQRNTRSRLPGSLEDGEVLDAGFRPSGRLRVDSRWFPLSRGPGMGGRSLQGA